MDEDLEKCEIETMPVVRSLCFLWNKRPTPADYLRVRDEGTVSLNSNEVLMLHNRLKIIQERTVQEGRRW